MCMQLSAIRPYQKWHWGGDEIVHTPIVPAARTVAGSRRRGYDIDIRSYLSIDSNTVLRRWLHDFVDRLPMNDHLRFQKREPGHFDFRVDIVNRAMQQLRYRPSNRRFDQWLFPEETLALGGGDCEDLAFLLAALLAEAGISPDCIRVALGSIVSHTPAPSPDAPTSWDHAWVMYQTENGAWSILEPLARLHRPGPDGRRGATHPLHDPTSPPPDVSYIPHYVFNSHHLWRVRGPHLRADAHFPDYLHSRMDHYWDGFDPSFAAGVHADIFDRALAGMSATDLLVVKSVSLAIDVDVLKYDPRDHFDFAYIPEGWERIRQRLDTGRLVDFAKAAHSIADFYAHSLYAHFTPTDTDPQGREVLPLYDPERPLPVAPDYTFLSRVPRPGDDHDDAWFAQSWAGRVISGQWWRWYTTYPDDLKPGLSLHRCLPDHDRLAVDSPDPPRADPHALYPDDATYRRQYTLRRAAAESHVGQAYAGWLRRHAGGGG